MPGPLLIANRGEIAVRIARTARRLGIETVAIASDPDRGAPHTRACDRVVAIGGERAVDSYLRIDRIVAAARAAGAASVHPGYGFLAEHAGFADAVLAAGLQWIGPPPEAMRAMGDKAEARRRMLAAGVPVLPGDDGADQDRSSLRRQALRIGLPVMVKAAAGGGGRGMRRVDREDDLDAAIQAAAAEAQAAFGDARVLLERAVSGARHVEIQVFGDAQGRLIHLGERDCSAQRRHQKIVEEAPSPAVSPALRRRMGEAAVAVARAVGYRNAGTVEFLLDADGGFWFIEMNTRLQVEHALTEALLGIDLVEWQLRIADGEALPIDQADALRRFESGGHAIEARLCAEDPGQDYLPRSGRVVHWAPPAGLRCDHALEDGAVVSPFYDSMLAKVVAHAPSRVAALAALAAGLDRTVCLGVATNRAFLARLLRDPRMTEGAVTTDFLAARYADDASRAIAPTSWLEALAAAATALLPRRPLPVAWQGWSSSPGIDLEVPLESGDAVTTWRLRGRRDDLIAEAPAGRHRIVGLSLAGMETGEAGTTIATVDADVDGRALRLVQARDGDRGWWQCEGHASACSDARLHPRRTADVAASGAVRAPMHGRVTRVVAAPGDIVRAGTLLLVMEAMKMEHRLHAPRDGTVGAVHARAGDQVAARQTLVEIA